MNSCLKNKEVPVHQRRCRPLLGTFVEIAVEGNEGAHLDAAINAAFATIERVQHLMSFHEAASEVSALNRRAVDQGVAVSLETYQVLKYAKELYERTQGVFDITVASELMGRGLLPQPAFLNKNYSGRASDIELLPENVVHFLQPLCIDLGGLAKGFAVDLAVQVLQQNGIQNGLVNAGGDLRCFGNQEQPIWIRPSAGYGEVLSGPLQLKNTAVATSAVRTDSIFSKNFATAAHVKMPSGEIINETKTATVIAPECVAADALTKVVLLGSAKLVEQCLLFYQARALVFDNRAVNLRKRAIECIG